LFFALIFKGLALSSTTCVSFSLFIVLPAFFTDVLASFHLSLRFGRGSCVSISSLCLLIVVLRLLWAELLVLILTHLLFFLYSVEDRFVLLSLVASVSATTEGLVLLSHGLVLLFPWWLGWLICCGFLSHELGNGELTWTS
jgi:hypothetical protein